MANPGDDNYLSQRDPGQVLRAAFDDNTKRLRTDAVISAQSIDIEVEIDAADGDNIAIASQDGSNFANINPDGSLDVNVVGGELQIEISAADGDNIAISDGTDTLDVNADGSINVNVLPNGTGNIVNTYNEVTAVASGVLTTIETYTATGTAFLQKSIVSGTNIARFDVLLNGNVIDRQRTYFGGNLNIDFDFTNLPLVFGDVVTVRVIHNRPTTGDFNARIQVLEY